MISLGTLSEEREKGTGPISLHHRLKPLPGAAFRFPDGFISASGGLRIGSGASVSFTKYGEPNLV